MVNPSYPSGSTCTMDPRTITGTDTSYTEDLHYGWYNLTSVKEHTELLKKFLRLEVLKLLWLSWIIPLRVIFIPQHTRKRIGLRGVPLDGRGWA